MQIIWWIIKWFITFHNLFLINPNIVTQLTMILIVSKNDQLYYLIFPDSWDYFIGTNAGNC